MRRRFLWLAFQFLVFLFNFTKSRFSVSHRRGAKSAETLRIDKLSYALGIGIGHQLLDMGLKDSLKEKL
ncbi:MAG: hypothetical protein KBS94_01585 [Prevotella sp.]|nr:hypothetical protein [Candidatus Equicola faecalis]